MTEPARPLIPLIPQKQDPLTEDEWRKVIRFVTIIRSGIPLYGHSDPPTVLVSKSNLQGLARAIQELNAALARPAAREEPRQWLCPHCHQANASGDWCCKVCQKSPRRHPIKRRELGEREPFPTGWNCPECRRVHAPFVLTCPKCPQRAEPVVVRASSGVELKGYRNGRTPGAPAEPAVMSTWPPAGETEPAAKGKLTVAEMDMPEPMSPEEFAEKVKEAADKGEVVHLTLEEKTRKAVEDGGVPVVEGREGGCGCKEGGGEAEIFG